MRGMKASSETGPCDNRQASPPKPMPARRSTPQTAKAAQSTRRRKGGLEAFGFTGGGEALGLANSDIR